MNPSNLIQLPPPKPASAETEAKILGAALRLRINAIGFEQLGLAVEVFGDRRVRNCWVTARRLAARNKPVSAATVFAAGSTARVLSDADGSWLEELELSSIATEAELRVMAESLRIGVQAKALGQMLIAEGQRCNAGDFNEARLHSLLEGLLAQVARDSAPDEDASGDAVEVLNDWDANEKTGKSLYLPTGIKAIDEAIQGLPQNLTLLVSGPGVGKTAVLDTMLHAQLVNDSALRIGFAGLEDGTKHVMRRWTARAMGLPLREVGWKPRTPEQRLKSEECAEAFFPLLQRIICYRHDSITTDALVTRAAAWKAKYDIGALYVDNLYEVEHTSQRGTDEWQRIAETSRRVRNFAVRTHTASVLLVHSTGGEGPATTADIAGGKALGRRARLQISLFKKNHRLFASIEKATEQGEQGTVVELERIAAAAMIDPDAGGRVDLEAEARAEAASKSEQRMEATVARKLKRQAIEARMKALEHDKAEVVQPTLFDGSQDADAK